MATARAGGTAPGEGQRSPANRVRDHKAAYYRGFGGDAETDEIANDPKLRASYRRGLRDARGEGRAAEPAPAAAAKGSPGPAVTRPARAMPGRPAGIGVQAGGFTLGIIGYAVAINYLRYGVAGVKALAMAKMFNRVSSGPWSSQGAPSTSSTPGVGEGPGQKPFYLVPAAGASA